MKQILFVILALLLSSQTLSAQAFELFFKVHDNGTLVNFLIEVYDVNNKLVRQGTTTNSNDFGKYGAANGAANIYPGDQPGATFSQLPRSGTWKIVIGVKSFSLTIDPNLYQSGDLYISYNVTTHDMFIEDHSTVLNYSTPESVPNKYEIQLTNDFANVTNGSGLFNISGSILSNPSYKRIYAYFPYLGFPKTVTAVTGLEQIYPPVTGTPRVFNRWINTQASYFTINTAQNIQETASFYDGFKVTFSNSYGSSFTDGLINADGQQRSSPYVYAIVQGSYTSASAITQNKYVPNSNNYIELTLDHWSTALPVTPAQNDQIYYCYLKGKPIHASRNLRANDSSFGSNVQLTWDEFNDPDITGYQIWRRVKHNGVLGDPAMIAFVSNRFTTSYIDYDYVITQHLVDLLKYDVRAVYDPGPFNDWDQPAITTDINYVDVFGQMSLFTNSDSNKLSEISLAQELPSEYSMSNYPNPFNPTTTINYQLPESGLVTIKVFDILGNEIATLVNENKTAGYYHVEFNAAGLASGIYIYSLQAGNFIQSKKMILVQ